LPVIRRKGLDRAPDAGLIRPDRQKPMFSVVIPCYNAKGTIRLTLDALFRQDTREPFEIIVVDSSSDGTDEIVRREFPDVSLIHLGKRTLPGPARNLGIRHASGGWIAFTDSDCVPDPDWLSRLSARHRTMEAEALGGSVVNGYPRHAMACVGHLIEFNEWLETAPAGYIPNIPSCNVSYKRAVFRGGRIESDGERIPRGLLRGERANLNISSVHGQRFPARQTAGKAASCGEGLQFTDVYPSEDTLFHWALAQKGGRIYFDPLIRVTHLGRRGFRDLLEHQERLGLASAEARRRSTLPGRFFATHPAFCVFLPLIRWMRLAARLLRYDRRKLVLLGLLTPLYGAAAAAWSIGFAGRSCFSDPVFSSFPTAGHS